MSGLSHPTLPDYVIQVGLKEEGGEILVEHILF